MENQNENRKAAIKKYVVFFLAEFIGTAIMMYVGCLGTVLENYTHLQPMLVATTFGLGITASIQAIGHISGPHLNPGVSLGAFIMNRLTWDNMLVYFAGQYTGAFFGYGMLWVQMPASSVDLKPCALVVHEFVGVTKVFFLEFSVSLILILVVGGATDFANKDRHDSVALRFGFVIYGFVVAIAELSGACLNSARALPSAVFNNEYQSHWVFHLGPVLGQVVGAFFYKFVFDTSGQYSLNNRRDKPEPTTL